MYTTNNIFKASAIATAVFALFGCGDGGGAAEAINAKPTFVGAMATTSFDGVSDDLLTAGLGKTGLGGTAPVAVDPLNPTPAELRKIAIFNNYRAILDISASGGYGML